MTDVLIEAVEDKISFTDFFHDKAFHCVLQLLMKIFLLDHKDEARKEWFRGVRDRIHQIMNVADLKLCEYYW